MVVISIEGDSSWGMDFRLYRVIPRTDERVDICRSGADYRYLASGNTRTDHAFGMFPVKPSRSQFTR